MNVCNDLKIGLAAVGIICADQRGPDVAADVVDVSAAAGTALGANVGDNTTGVRIQLRNIVYLLEFINHIPFLFTHDLFLLWKQ